MTTITLPISNSDYAPHFETLAPRDPNWVGRIVQWVRNAESHGILYKVLVYTITFLISGILMVSVIFCPLFIYGYKEYLRQSERAYYDQKLDRNLQIAIEYGKLQFLRGRLDPLQLVNIRLKSSTRQKMIYDLEIPKNEAAQKKDHELLLQAAAKYDNFIERYGLSIRN